MSKLLILILSRSPTSPPIENSYTSSSCRGKEREPLERVREYGEMEREGPGTYLLPESRLPSPYPLVMTHGLPLIPSSPCRTCQDQILAKVLVYASKCRRPSASPTGTTPALTPSPQDTCHKGESMSRSRLSSPHRACNHACCPRFLSPLPPTAVS